MKKEDIPQDKSSLEKGNHKELYYAVDETGKYVTGKSSGWDPKTIALDNTLEELDDRIAKAWKDVQEQKVSPIAYFMEVHRMDLSILSSYVGLWKWRVKRHLKPNIFNKLSNKLLEKYAVVFEISVHDLKTCKAIHEN